MKRIWNIIKALVIGCIFSIMLLMALPVFIVNGIKKGTLRDSINDWGECVEYAYNWISSLLEE